MLPVQLAGLLSLGGLAAAVASPRDLLALTAMVLVGLALTLLAYRAGGPCTVVPGRAVSLRQRARGAAFQRLRDPDAAGRPRPRAPSAAPAAS
jgi:hypothetical protein